MTRDELERALAKRFGRSFTELQRRILAELDGEDGLTRLNANEFWDEAAKEYPWIGTLLKEAAVAAAIAVLPATLDAFGRQSAEAAAERWAQTYSLNLIGGIMETSRQQTTATLDQWFAGQIDRQGLERQLSGIFSPDRASTIGVTESTRAATNGQLSAGSALRDMGFTPRYIWHQTSDYEGCGCDELNDQEVDESTTPPLHPNCNCYITTEFEGAE